MEMVYSKLKLIFMQNYFPLMAVVFLETEEKSEAKEISRESI